jgi:hypothetical protein
LVIATLVAAFAASLPALLWKKEMDAWKRRSKRAGSSINNNFGRVASARYLELTDETEGQFAREPIGMRLEPSPANSAAHRRR